MNKQYLDYMIQWFYYCLRTPKLWLLAILLATPLSLLSAMASFKEHFLSPSFAGVEQIKNGAQVYITDANIDSPFDTSMLNEIEQFAPQLKASLERQILLDVKQPFTLKAELENISFFSGGYKALGLKAYKGSFDTLEFPAKGTDITAAISYSFWQAALSKGDDLLNTTLLVNGQAVKVVAVLPKTFTSFRKGSEVSLVIPYVFKESIAKQTILTPDTFSYLLGASLHEINEILKKIQPKLIDDFFIFDDNELSAFNAFGISPSEHKVTMNRVSLISFVFWVLLVFCSIAFFGFMAGEEYKKQKEYTVRAMCGASYKDIKKQKYIEATMLAFFITILTFILQPFSLLFIFNFFDTSIVQVGFTVDLLEFVFVFLACIVCLLFISSLQEKYITTALGRSTSLTLGERIQSYALLSLLITVTTFSLYMATVATIKQWQLSKVDLGFDFSNVLYIEMDIDNGHQTTFFANDKPQQVVYEIQKLEGIAGVALSSAVANYDRKTYSEWFTVSREPIGATKQTSTSSITVTPEYFTVMGSQILTGEEFDYKDYKSVLVNQTLWQQYFADVSLADAFLLRPTSSGDFTQYKVLGVVEDIHYDGPDTDPIPVVYSLLPSLTGSEMIVIKYENDIQNNNLGVIDSVLGNIDISYSTGNEVTLEALVDIEKKPRNQITMLTVMIALLLLLSSLLFCASLVQQLLQKLGLELSLKRSMGARVFNLFKQIYLPFLFAYSFMVLFAFISLHFQKSHLLIEWPLSDFMKWHQLLSVCFILLIMTSFVFYRYLIKNIKNTWKVLG